MKSKIQNTIAALNAQKDYIENNSDFTEQFDLLLEGDCEYYREQWCEAIEHAAGELSHYLDNDVFDQIITAILGDVTGYCDVSYHAQGFPHAAPSGTIALANLGEHEIQLDTAPTWSAAIAYIERKTDWSHNNGLWYLGAEYDQIHYTLKPDAIRETIRNIAQDCWESNAEFLLSDSRGIYIPRDFLDFAKFREQLSAETVEVLENPENEFYWDEWGSVLSKTFLVDGVEWCLYQDGDLFAYKRTMPSIAWLSVGGM